MKWMIVLLLAAPVGQEVGSGGQIKYQLEYDNLRDCSFEAVKLKKNWLDQHEEVEIESRKKLEEAFDLLLNKYPREKLDEVEQWIRFGDEPGEGFYIYAKELSEQGDDEFAKDIKELGHLQRWSGSSNKYITEKSEFICVPST